MEVMPAQIFIAPSEQESTLESKNFDIKSNKMNNFEIKISRNINHLTFEGKYKNTLESNIYFSKKTLEELKINKYFLMFENLKEIYDELINLIQNNNPNLIEENNILLISIPLSTTKIKEIIIEINEKEKSDKEKIEDIYLVINNLKSYYNNKINELNNKIENQNNKISELNNKIENQNNKINEFQKKLEEKNNCNINNEINTTIFNDSLIINQNNTYISHLKKWISPYDIPFTTKLLFRKSKNGESFDEFHRLCDNQGKTLVLIQGKEGFIIGGYTTKNWNITDMWYKDDDSFLFSLTKGKIFPNKKNRESILSASNIGPWFAYIGCINEGRNNLSQGKFYYRNKDQESFENYEEIIPNKKCDRLFDVIEVEIYKIDFN